MKILNKILKKFRAWAKFLIPSLLISCEQPIVPDPIDPRLPAYYNSGDNVAGALINDSTWVAKQNVQLLAVSKELILSMTAKILLYQ